MPIAKRITLVLLLLTSISCVSVQPAPATTASAPVTPPAPAPASIPKNDALLNPVLWIQTAAEYRAAARQAYNVAARMLDVALVDPQWTAAIEQSGDYSKLPPAVILDVDETVLDNSPYEARMIHLGLAFDAKSFTDWVNEAKADPVPGSLEFIQNASRRGVTIFYVTNRDPVEEPATRANLARHGYTLSDSLDTLLLRGEIGKTSDKGDRRRWVAERYRVLLLVGDDFGDFTSNIHVSIEERRTIMESHADRWGMKWIIVPNPMYGSWERAILRSDPPLTPEQSKQRKYDTLRTAN